MSEAVITVIVSAVVSVITLLLKQLFDRRKNSADAAKTITDAAQALIDPLTERIDALEKKVTVQDKRIDRYAKRVIYLMGGIEQLIRQVSVHEPPCWQPDEWTSDDD